MNKPVVYEVPGFSKVTEIPIKFLWTDELFTKSVVYIYEHDTNTLVATSTNNSMELKHIISSDLIDARLVKGTQYDAKLVLYGSNDIQISSASDVFYLYYDKDVNIKFVGLDDDVLKYDFYVAEISQYYSDEVQLDSYIFRLKNDDGIIIATSNELFTVGETYKFEGLSNNKYYIFECYGYTEHKQEVIISKRVLVLFEDNKNYIDLEINNLKRQGDIEVNLTISPVASEASSISYTTDENGEIVIKKQKNESGMYQFPYVRYFDFNTNEDFNLDIIVRNFSKDSNSYTIRLDGYSGNRQKILYIRPYYSYTYDYIECDEDDIESFVYDGVVMKKVVTSISLEFTIELFQYYDELMLNNYTIVSNKLDVTNDDAELQKYRLLLDRKNNRYKFIISKI